MKTVCQKSMSISIVVCAVLALSPIVHSQEKKEEKIADEMTRLNKGLKDAATRGDIPTMEAYLKKGANPNWHDPADRGKTALIRAIFTKKVPVAKLLLENGADVNFQAADGYKAYPVYFAGVISSVEMAQYILAKGGDKDVNKEPGMLGSLCAHRTVPAEMITIMVKAGADPNVLYDRKTPLITAIEKGRPDYVQALIEAKADLNWKDKKGMTTMQYAIAKGNAEIITMLKKAGAKD